MRSWSPTGKRYYSLLDRRNNIPLPIPRPVGGRSPNAISAVAPWHRRTPVVVLIAGEAKATDGRVGERSEPALDDEVAADALGEVAGLDDQSG